MSYQAIITPVQAILPHPNADRLELVLEREKLVLLGYGRFHER
jgi:hypothetical protein